MNGMYLVGNYPDRKTFIRASEEGMKYFDFLEIGIPFSDPVADGPVIADVYHEMLRANITVREILDATGELRSRIPSTKSIYYMTYSNIIHSHGLESFASACEKTGVSGVIVPDVPFSESLTFRKAFTSRGLNYIHFVSPENTSAQIEQIARSATGFLYFISMRGITGGTLKLDEETIRKIDTAVKHSPVPVVLGFGIRDRSSIDVALQKAGGFIMGTRLIETLRDGGIETYSAFLKEIFQLGTQAQQTIKNPSV